jgi:hypothetical protein
MATLHDILVDAGDGEALVTLGSEFGLSPQQTESAVTALLPAISTGLKKATATPEGLGNLFGIMGYQQDLHEMHGDPEAALGPGGRAAGNDVLSVIFGSPDVSLAVVDQAQKFSGVSSEILKKMLPALAGIAVSGLMGGKSSRAVSQRSGTTGSSANKHRRETASGGRSVGLYCAGARQGHSRGTNQADNRRRWTD